MLLCGAGSAFAQSLSLEFRDGRVRLAAENVPVSRVLEEWARVGGTRIVHGEQIPGASLTLQIVDVPEQQALDIVLRGAAGYMAVARSAPAPGASTLEKILVLPTTTRVAAAAAPPPQQQPGPTAAQFFPRPDQEPVEPDENGPGLPAPVGGFPRGRVPGPPLNVPTNLPASAPLSDDSDDQSQNPPTPQASPGNPFGVIPGGARPGTITPAPQPQNPNQQPQGQVPPRAQPQQVR